MANGTTRILSDDNTPRGQHRRAESGPIERCIAIGDRKTGAESCESLSVHPEHAQLSQGTAAGATVTQRFRKLVCFEFGQGTVLAIGEQPRWRWHRDQLGLAHALRASPETVAALKGGAFLQDDNPANGDRFGSSVALNADGTVVAVGAESSDAPTASTRGTRRVFEYASGSWQPMGANIDGEAAGDASHRSRWRPTARLSSSVRIMPKTPTASQRATARLPARSVRGNQWARTLTARPDESMESVLRSAPTARSWPLARLGSPSLARVYEWRRRRVGAGPWIPTARRSFGHASP